MSPLARFKVAFTISFIFYLIIVLLPKSGGMSKDLKEMKGVIGSKPPVCVNKCMKCRPCKATVVINEHDHQKKKNKNKKGFKLVFSSHGGDEDDSYYLLSWKCRCGNKFFQP